MQCVINGDKFKIAFEIEGMMLEQITALVITKKIINLSHLIRCPSKVLPLYLR